MVPRLQHPQDAQTRRSPSGLRWFPRAAEREHFWCDPECTRIIAPLRTGTVLYVPHGWVAVGCHMPRAKEVPKEPTLGVSAGAYISLPIFLSTAAAASAFWEQTLDCNSGAIQKNAGNSSMYTNTWDTLQKFKQAVQALGQ